MELYEMYIQEREGAKLYYDDKSFFSYVIEAPYFQVKDLFVHPDYRRERVGIELGKKIEQLAKEYNCSTVYCTSCIEATNWQDSHLFILANGYRETGRGGTIVYYKKEI